MAEKIEKSIPWLVILALCFLIAFGMGIVLKEVIADTAEPSVTVGNQSPTVGTVILNTSTAIIINENSSVTVSGTTTISDNNGYGDIDSVTSTLFINNTSTCSSGLADVNWCYYITGTTNGTCVTSSCVGLSCVVTCTVNVWFTAEPSDASSSYSTASWQMDITAKDTSDTTDTGSSSQELSTAYYLDVDSTIPYGSVAPAATSTNTTTNATNTGNFVIDVELSGVNMETGGATASIAVGQQKYNSSTIITWDNMGTALTGTPAGFNIDLAKPTATSSNSTDLVYWVIKIPTTTAVGTYTGTNTVTAVGAL